MKDRNTIPKAGVAAQRWLRTIESSNAETATLRDHGLLFCECISSGSSAPKVVDGPRVRLPKPLTLTTMKRNDLLGLARTISASESWGIQSGREYADNWAKVLGGLALSYARVGDLELVAALVRSAANLRLNCVWLEEAHLYLLEQQQPSGCFGLIAAEAHVIADDAWTSHVSLRLTVEVLSALASVQCQMP